MSENTTETELAAASEKWKKRLVVVELDEEDGTPPMVLAFRPMNRVEIEDVRKRLGKSPDMALSLLTNAVEFCCVAGKSHFKRVAEYYPLLIAGEDSVADKLMEVARGRAKVSIR